MKRGERTLFGLPPGGKLTFGLNGRNFQLPIAEFGLPGPSAGNQLFGFARGGDPIKTE